MEALVAGGARRVAFLGDSLDIYTMRERYQGYRSALRKAGIGLDEDLVFPVAHSVEQAAAVVPSVLGGQSDAIFAANNRAAIGALAAFREAGRRLPLVGFDDFEAATLLAPEVSVVSQDVARMGERAAALLLDRLESPGADPVREVLDTRLVLRGSERA